MLDGIAGSFSSRPRSKFLSDWCTSLSVMKISVLPHQIITRRSRLLSFLNLLDVGDHLFGEVALVLPLLDVRAVEPLHVVLIEHGRPRPDLLELGPDLVEQRLLEDAGRLRGAVAVFLEDVPAAEHEIVESRQRNDFVDLRRAALGPLAEPDRAHLGQRADGLATGLCE